MNEARLSDAISKVQEDIDNGSIDITEQVKQRYAHAEKNVLVIRELIKRLDDAVDDLKSKTNYKARRVKHIRVWMKQVKQARVTYLLKLEIANTLLGAMKDERDNITGTS